MFAIGSRRYASKQIKLFEMYVVNIKLVKTFYIQSQNLKVSFQLIKTDTEPTNLHKLLSAWVDPSYEFCFHIGPALARPPFVYFRSFQTTFVQKAVQLNGIRTGIVRVQRKHTHH